MSKVYLLPGLGADERMYASQLKHLSIDVEVINWPVPRKGVSLKSYVSIVSRQIDDSKPFSLVGTSFGGIMAVELSKILHPEKIILISSIKCRRELPWHFRMLRYLPVHRLISGDQFKAINRYFAKLLASKRRSKYTKLITEMSDESNSYFISWAINEVICWNNTRCRKDIVHLHGKKDILFPASFIKDAEIIRGGSHIMILTHDAIINDLLEKYLK